MIAQQIFTDNKSADKLAQMGLSVDDFTYAISRAIYESRRSSPLHPRTDAGSRGWSETVAAFRESVLSDARGWNYTRSDGLEFTINSELGLSIIITSGDRDTGRIDGFPKTKNAKGSATENLVNKNYTLELFPNNDVTSIDEHDSSIDPTKTYVLLYYFDNAEHEVRCELSLPGGMSGASGYNKINSWLERIILPSVPFSAAINLQDREFNEAIDIKVSRK
ncbi:hypothetical protein [Yersinia enterocolitica]|nr:hypothetical protein [Yersinia enterocolitica]